MDGYKSSINRVETIIGAEHMLNTPEGGRRRGGVLEKGVCRGRKTESDQS